MKRVIYSNSATPITSATSSSLGFEIEGTVVVRYRGNDEHVVVPSGITEIGEGAFWGCKMASVQFPSSLTTIRTTAFCHCRNLKNIEWSTGLVTIERQAFAYSGIESVDVPEGVTTIDDGAFQFCSDLREASLPSTLSEVSSHLFAYCYNLMTLNLPSSISELGEDALASTPLEKKASSSNDASIAPAGYGTRTKSGYEDDITFDEWYGSDAWNDSLDTFVQNVEQHIRQANVDISEVVNDPSAQGMMGSDYWYVTTSKGTKLVEFNWEEEQHAIFEDGAEAVAAEYAQHILAQL